MNTSQASIKTNILFSAAVAHIQQYFGEIKNELFFIERAFL